MQGWATVVIAFAVALIGYAQWRTANHRVVLDLFERRLKVYDDLSEVMRDVLRHGAVSNDTLRAYFRGENAALFLFGSEVVAYLQSLRKDFAFLSSYSVDVIRQGPAEQMEGLYKHRSDAMLRIGHFFNDATTKKFSPYIRMDQKKTPWWRPW
jgi:hypothetical protein